MTPIEIIALIVILVAAIKIIVLLINPKSWMGVVRKVWTNPMITSVISLILAAVVLYYLLQEITIIQVFAAMALVGLLAALGIAAYSNEIVALGEKMLKDKAVIKKAWLALLIWIILIIWALKELFL